MTDLTELKAAAEMVIQQTRRESGYPYPRMVVEAQTVLALIARLEAAEEAMWTHHGGSDDPDCWVCDAYDALGVTK